MHMSQKLIRINRIIDIPLATQLYYVAIVLLMGIKAIGLDESNWGFRVIAFISFICIVIKLIIEKHDFLEWSVICGLLAYGVWTIYTSRSIGLLILLFMVVGMRGIDIKKLFRLVGIEYTICFVVTIFLALIGIRPGVELVLEKLGVEVLRRSLGYTHPNVLHVTYVILMILLLYGFDLHGKRLKILISVLLIMDLFVFCFSLSFTGMIMSIAIVCVWLYCERFHAVNNVPFSMKETLFAKCWVVFTILGFWLFCRIVEYTKSIDNQHFYEVANDFLNGRLLASNLYINDFGYSLFGEWVYLENWSLDSSYIYALMRYGLTFIILMVFAYSFTMQYMLKRNRYFDVAILIVLLFVGMSEQFLFNAAIKNLTVFMLGEWMFFALDHFRGRVEERKR